MKRMYRVCTRARARLAMSRGELQTARRKWAQMYDAGLARSPLIELRLRQFEANEWERRGPVEVPAPPDLWDEVLFDGVDALSTHGFWCETREGDGAGAHHQRPPEGVTVAERMIAYMDRLSARQRLRYRRKSMARELAEAEGLLK